MAKKDFGKRLMPEYLLQYSEDLFKNHPDPSAEWGGGGADYTAGYGIEISNDEISVDEDVIASKNELNGYIKDNDLNYASTFRGKGVYVKEEGTYTSTSYGDGAIGRSVLHQPGYTYTLPDKTGTFAMTVDIITSYNDLTDKPTIPTKTSDLTNDSGFITGVAWNDVTGKPTFATVATSGSYNDLTDKPTIPVVPTRAEAPFLGVTQPSDGVVLFSLDGSAGSYYKIVEPQVETHVNLQALDPNYGSGLTSSYNSSTKKLDVAIDTTTVALKSDIPTVPTNVSAFTNDSGYITGITSAMVTAALGYTPGTSSFSGSYNDLTDKPTIPTVNDPTITFTQGGVTKGTISLNQAANQTIALDAGGASPAYEITNMVVDSTNQTITLTITQNN